MIFSFQEPTAESKRRWATALLVAVLAAHLVLGVPLLLGHFDDIILESTVHKTHYNVLAFWLVLGTWKLRWRLTGAAAAAICFAASYYWSDVRTALTLGLTSMASPSFASKLSLAGIGLLMTSLPYLAALRYWFVLRRDVPDQQRLQFSMFGIMYVTALMFLAFMWIDFTDWLPRQGWSVGAVSGLYALPGVVACWAALGRHRPLLPVALALVFGFVFDDWWFFLLTGRLPSMPRVALLIVLVLLGTFLPLRFCGYRLVRRSELRNASASPDDAQ